MKRNSCNVYEHRPDTCRRHPFLITEHYILVAKSCPGIGWNREQKPEYYKEFSKEIANNIEAFLDKALPQKIKMGTLNHQTCSAVF